jgi:hypothetical protein
MKWEGAIAKALEMAVWALAPVAALGAHQAVRQKVLFLHRYQLVLANADDRTLWTDSIWRLVQLAWEQVQSNARACGVDGISVAHFEKDSQARLLAVKEHLKQGSCQPKPVRRVYIPKPGCSEPERSGDSQPQAARRKSEAKQKRPLGIPTVTDRVVQTATKMVIEPIDRGYGAAQSTLRVPRLPVLARQDQRAHTPVHPSQKHEENEGDAQAVYAAHQQAEHERDSASDAAQAGGVLQLLQARRRRLTDGDGQMGENAFAQHPAQTRLTPWQGTRT